MDKVLAISMGEPAGIGPDLILALYAQRVALELPAFCVFGNADFLRARAARLGLAVDIAAIEAAEAADTFGTALPVVEVGGPVTDQPGQIAPEAARVVIGAIEMAVAATLG